jgi:2-hydroxychromene-2-carboxylate isomerase
MSPAAQAPVDVEFLFDFGSPNAYLVHRVIPRLQAAGRLRFVYVPVLLGGLFKQANNRSPMQAYAEIPLKMAYEQLEMRRFIQRHGLKAFRMNPHFPVNTLQAMRVAVAAQHLGCFEPCVEALFAAMWEHGAPLGDAAVLSSTLAAAGLDAPALLAASQRDEVKAGLLDHTQRAHARGAFGSPTFFVGAEMWFGKERLADIEAWVAARP